MNNNEETVAERIQQRYGQIVSRFNERGIALPLDVDGSNPLVEDADVRASAILAEMLYERDDLIGLPEGAAAVALGCGNPTAIAGLNPGETVLDLGSGGGIDCFLAAKAVGRDGRVIGVDMTDEMLAIANKHKTQLGHTNVEFRKGAIEALPVEDATIDVVISNCVVDISPDKAAVFAEAFRVLKPGGRLAISDLVIEGEFPEQIKANIDAWAGCTITPLISQKDFLRYIREAEFVDVVVEARVSYGLENLDALDESSRDLLTKNADWSTVPDDAGLYSAQIRARKPA